MVICLRFVLLYICFVGKFPSLSIVQAIKEPCNQRLAYTLRFRLLFHIDQI